MADRNFLKIYQIYFNESQKDALSYEPYFNSSCTEFFENSAMRDLIEDGKHLDGRYFGVFPPGVSEKINWINKRHHHHLANADQSKLIDVSSQHLTKKSIIKADVISFTCQIIADPITEIEWMHKNLGVYFKEIMSKIGYDWKPTIFQHVIYSNLFIAKSQVYERFVKEMLAPAMDVMMEMPELFQHSGYPKTLSKELQDKFNCEHYPYHSFLCERMISYFIHIHNLNCKHF